MMFFVFIKKKYSKELKRRIDFSGHDLLDTNIMHLLTPNFILFTSNQTDFPLFHKRYPPKML